MKKTILTLLSLILLVSLFSNQTTSPNRAQRTRNRHEAPQPQHQHRNITVFWSEDFNDHDDIPPGWQTTGWVFLDDWGFGMDETNSLTADVDGDPDLIEFGFDTASITTPSIGPLPENAKLEFWYQMWASDGFTWEYNLTDDIEGLTVEVRINQQVIYTIDNSNHSRIGWSPIVLDLSAFANQTINITWFAHERGIWPYIWDTDTVSVFTENGSGDITEVYIGNPDSTLYNIDFPYNYHYYNNIAQVIYLNNEITTTGEITAVTMRFDGPGLIPDDIPVKLYMYSGFDVPDTFESTSSWIPYVNFNKVFEGPLPVDDWGYYDITITLDTAYEYTNGNLVLMFHRTYDQTEVWGAGWQETITSGNRSLHQYTDDVVYNPSDSFPTGRLENFRPNINLHFTPNENPTTATVHIYLDCGNENPLFATAKLEGEGGVYEGTMFDFLPYINLTNVNYGYYKLTIEHVGFKDYVIENFLVNEELVEYTAVLEPNVSIEDKQDILNIGLLGNYPNPFNPSTIIKFTVVKDTPVLIDVFNIRGQIVRTLTNEMYTTGYHEVEWNGKDDHGNEMSSGIYFYRLMIDDLTDVKRMVMLK